MTVHPKMTIENKNKVEDRPDISICAYQQALHDFLSKNNFVSFRQLDEKEIYCFVTGIQNVKDLFNPKEKFQFIKNPINPESSRLLDNPHFLYEYFKEKGYKTSEPKPIVNSNGTTLFISSGVQILENVFQNEDQIPQEHIFVAQPVFRTQYIEFVDEGISTSFINVSIESINKTTADHFQNLQNLLNFFDALGLRKNDYHFEIDHKDSKWGDKKHRQQRIKIYYQGLEIGDALFIENFPQNSRDYLQISDIGFGLERLKWVLRGGSYWEQITSGACTDYTSKTIDFTRTLSLLAGSGVVPHFKAHGYRFRLLSKRLTEECIREKRRQDLDILADSFYDQWSNWTRFTTPKEEAINLIRRERVRNFNAELISRLKEFYYDVDVDISKPTEEVVMLLRGTSANPKHVQDILQEMGGPIK